MLPKFHTKTLILSSIITSVIVGLLIVFNFFIDRWTSDLIESNKTLTAESVHELNVLAEKFIDSLWSTPFSKLEILTKKDVRELDSQLRDITDEEFNRVSGLEGGFYFSQFEEFYGYSFPSSPEPKPAYGPPPRSYNIIKDQILKSLKEKRHIVDIHQFDPAIFPLATEPIKVKGEIIGCVWARIHIERDFPMMKLRGVFQIAAIVSLCGFVIAVLISRIQHNRMEEIKIGLEKLRSDNSFRFKTGSGVFGYISESINKMIDLLTSEHSKREKLEKEIHQQDKMASLGKLIAAVAHEVKTPLSIIKTRIQMWQKDFRELGPQTEVNKIISEESIQLVDNEINRLSSLVNRLLRFSKPVSKKELTKINNLIDQSLGLLSVKISEQKIKIHLECDSNLPASFVDPIALGQVFINIIMNSLEAMTSDQELIIKTALNRNMDTIQIIIQDSGIGIPDNIKENIFTPFFTTKDHGVGLGLPIAFEIIKAHNGSIKFTQPKTQGTVCTITIPINN
jgi:signal transduction histidine kinase